MSPMIASQLEVLRRVDRGDAAGRAARGRSSSGMMPPTTTGASTPSAREQRDDLGHELEVAARQDRQADHVDVLVARRRRDLLGREADALVDDLHAGVAGGDGDLLGAVGVAVEAGLGHEEPGRPAGHAP